MPTPTSGESRDHFMARCIPMVMNEGKTQDQAKGECEGIFDQHDGKTIDDQKSEGVKVNGPGITHGKSLAKSGTIDRGEWNGDAVERSAANATSFAAVDSSHPPEEKGHWKFPIISGGKVSARGVGNALSRAKTNGYTDVASALEEISKLIHDHADSGKRAMIFTQSKTGCKTETEPLVEHGGSGMRM